jgi:hypothetical protein
MEVPKEQQQPVGASTECRTANELVELIRKLRWAGMDEEAKELVSELTRRWGVAAETVLAAASETD